MLYLLGRSYLCQGSERSWVQGFEGSWSEGCIFTPQKDLSLSTNSGSEGGLTTIWSLVSFLICPDKSLPRRQKKNPETSM